MPNRRCVSRHNGDDSIGVHIIACNRHDGVPHWMCRHGDDVLIYDNAPIVPERLIEFPSIFGITKRPMSRANSQLEANLISRIR